MLIALLELSPPDNWGARQELAGALALGLLFWKANLASAGEATKIPRMRAQCTIFGMISSFFVSPEMLEFSSF
jgi:hypothetical protein